MKCFVEDGEIVEVTAPYDVASGAGFLVGVLFAVAVASALSGALLNGRRRGVFDLPKAPSQAWTAWTTKIYWDNTAKVLTSTVGSNTLVGVAAAAVGSGAGETTGRVLLTGQIT